MPTVRDLEGSGWLLHKDAFPFEPRNLKGTKRSSNPICPDPRGSAVGSDRIKVERSTDAKAIRPDRGRGASSAFKMRVESGRLDTRRASNGAQHTDGCLAL